MRDEADTLTKWVCPRCKDVVEADFGQIAYEIQRHVRHCPEQPAKVVAKSPDVTEG